MAEKPVNWTEQQRRAIAARGSDVLVSASAGTGKTAVLSGRCVGIVSDPGLCPDVLSILVLTFTEAAAEEMHLRIAQQLAAAFSESGDSRLRHQLMLLQAAEISTIHSFCKRLITEYFYELDLDPTFRVIDADEAGLLKTETLEKTIDWAWRQEHLCSLLPQLLNRRSLQSAGGFLNNIISLSDFLDGLVSREKWYERALSFAAAADPFATELGDVQKDVIADRLRRILRQIRYAQRLYDRQSTDGDWSAGYEKSLVEPVERCIACLEAGDWTDCARMIRNFPKPRAYKPKDLPKTEAERLKEMIGDARDAFVGLSDMALLNPDYLDRVNPAAGAQTQLLIELAAKFDSLYAQAKRTLNALDFADLEHYALRLLAEPGSLKAEPAASQTAIALRRRYRYIFVDEYQDINPVQQAILTLISSSGNRFGVGDIKQSIYAFRGAVPQIFAAELAAAAEQPGAALTGLRIDLNTNFRSDQRILDFVNKVFSRLMTADSFAEIDYDQSAQLRAASPDTAGSARSAEAGTAVEFHILDEADSDAEDDQPDEYANEPDNFSVVTARQRQAAAIARRIRQMVGADTGTAEFRIYDRREERLRDVEYRDIVILMRSLIGKANDYVEILRLAGVPVGSAATAGYFETTEITDMLSLLRVLDNPQRDIELAAVLRSPFFNVTDSELAKIRICGTKDKGRNNVTGFYDCVQMYHDDGPDTELVEKLNVALDRIDFWRTMARRGSIADLIWTIYRRTGYLSFVSALPNGRSRRANLLKLHDRAIQFEHFAGSSPIPSLNRFVAFIEKLLQTSRDWAPAEPEASAGNAVRILSVHRSKGLEFPVVFFAGLQSQFNRSDLNGECLFDAEHTVGLRVIDPESNTSLSSLAHQVIREHREPKMLAEEMRILYVAATRARDRLILTASAKSKACENALCNGLFSAGEPVPDWQLRRCKSSLEWILYALADRRCLHEAFETGKTDGTCEDALFDLKFYRRRQLDTLSDFVLSLKSGKAAPTKKHPQTRKQTPSPLLSKVSDSLAWRYQFAGAPALPAKQSVTDLTHHGDEFARFDYSQALDRLPRTILAADTVTEPQAGAIGSATHLVISRLDLKEPVTEAVVDETIEQLLAGGAITMPIAERIDRDSILLFFQSDLGRTALDRQNTILREWPFTFALPAQELDALGRESRAPGHEVIVVQGVIDMLIRTPQALVVIDFKTDNVTAAEVDERAEVYRRQLQLYAGAAAAIFRIEVTGSYLYFLRPRLALKIA